MAGVDLLEFMSLYARLGIADWQKAPAELRKRAAQCLGSEIADNDAEAAVTIQTIYDENNADRLRFIPMPKRPKAGIERCFFLPIRQFIKGGTLTASFDLFLLVAGRNCLAFRFEPAHAPSSAHGYNHVQMSQKLLRKTVVANTLSWLPDTYPAFPLHVATSDPLRMFLSLTTAVHGYGRSYASGMSVLLQDIFQAAGRAPEAPAYLSVLNSVLN